MEGGGIIAAISPVNMSIDGDTVFVFSTEKVNDFLSPIGKAVTKTLWHNIRVYLISHAAANVVQESIYDACVYAKTISLNDSLGGIIPSASVYPKKIIAYTKNK